MYGDIAINDAQFKAALDTIKEQLGTFFDHDVPELVSEWETLTGEGISRATSLALADLRLTFSQHEIIRALRITAYRNGFRRPADDPDPTTAPISTWAVRQILVEWRADGRYGLEG